MKYLADGIACLKIVFSLLLLTVPVFSMAFYAVYILAGISDMMDGTVARMTHTVMDFGS